MGAELPPGLYPLPSLLALVHDAFVGLVMLNSAHATPPIGVGPARRSRHHVNGGRVTYGRIVRQRPPDHQGPRSPERSRAHVSGERLDDWERRRSLMSLAW